MQQEEQDTMKRKIVDICSRVRLALLAGVLVVAGSSLAFSKITQPDGEAPPPVRLTVDTTEINRDSQLTPSFAPVVKQIAPSVVKVFTTATVKQARQTQQPLLDDPFFRRFFGPEFRGEDVERQFRAPKRHGLGSGVIVTEDGYILTNNHVIDGADTVKVALSPDGREYTAKVVGKDPKTDIAVLKIEAENLPHLSLADSDKVEVGDLVLAVGNPFGIGQTVTMGMVSATGRASMGLGLDYEDFIQTDAAINPGNSGGALVDLQGRLVGINTAILSRSGGNQGIGFAVPINLARTVMENLVEHGRVVRGFLGVNIQDITSELAKEFDLDEPRGALVAEVTPDSPAEKAGLKNGDVIVEFNGKEIRDSRHLKLQVGQTAPDQDVTVKLIRDGKPETVEVRLKEFPDAALATLDGKQGTEASREHLAGVAVDDIDANTRNQLRLPRGLHGALVTNVDPTSPAYEAGLRKGDILLEMNRQPIRNAEDAIALSNKIEDNTILLRVWREGASRYVVVDETKAG